MWIKPLLSGDIIKSDPTTFVENVFFNLDSIEKANGALALALERRQTDHYLVPAIGDIMLQHVCNFDPFVAYGAHQMIGKFHFELEKKRNPGFSKFVEVK